MGFKSKETPQLSDLIGQEQTFGIEQVTLGFASEVCKYETVLMWRHFPAKSKHSSLKEEKSFSEFDKSIFKLGPDFESQSNVHKGVF